jgi:spore germination cell wall hydrolase CwlJ-like protein
MRQPILEQPPEANKKRPTPRTMAWASGRECSLTVVGASANRAVKEGSYACIVVGEMGCARAPTVQRLASSSALAPHETARYGRRSAS